MIGRLKSKLRPFWFYRAVRFPFLMVADRRYRRDHLLLWRRPRNLFQHHSVTSRDRYPKIFSFVRDALEDRLEPRLLSFGCATGEEVFSLRSYFPGSFIKGIDINPANVRACLDWLRRAGVDRTITFACAASAEDEPENSYDAVFCMAVFQSTRLKTNHNVATCEAVLDFDEFSRVASRLAACVKPGGYFIIRYAMFHFADLDCSRDFRPVLRQPRPFEFIPQFGRDNRRLPNQECEDVVFQKTPRLT